MTANPMDFYVRQFEDAWLVARDGISAFVGARPASLALLDNATAGMNVVAQSLRLRSGDEVLLNDHEYGAVRRIWERACARQDATLRVVPLGNKLEEASDIVDAIWSGVNQRTRLIVLSHITSATAITLPVEEVCQRASQAGVPVCIDGPHAVAQLPLALDTLGCDYYVASCHKWLCGPLGSGFIYARPEHHARLTPLVQSWGRVMPAQPVCWSDEFMWTGTRDFSPLLALAQTVDFWTPARLQTYRDYSRTLAEYARERLAPLTDRTPLLEHDSERYRSMAHMPLPSGPTHELQRLLWEKHRIEIPVIEWQGERYIRVSCHLYNEAAQIDRLIAALADLGIG
jgi:isopenicillin-N epimerase